MNGQVIPDIDIMESESGLIIFLRSEVKYIYTLFGD